MGCLCDDKGKTQYSINIDEENKKPLCDHEENKMLLCDHDQDTHHFKETYSEVKKSSWPNNLIP